MVFSSVPLFLDPPNWHQPPKDETQRVAQSMPVVAAAAATSSMTEIPGAEGPLKCPRCDSSNTKFCYFNNYRLTQPRHFCKTCRRYWTRGGSLRSVPVGGGCRRNKRKRSSARRPGSPTAANPAQQPPHPALAEFMAPPPPPTTQPFSYMASLHSLMTSQVGMGGFGGNNNNSHYELPDLLGCGFGVSSSSSMYPFQNSNSTMEGLGMLETASFGKGLLGVPNHLQPQAKMEGNGARVNLLSKQFVTDDVGVSQHQHQLFWNGVNTNSNSINHAGLWTDLSGMCSSSTTTTLNTIMR